MQIANSMISQFSRTIWTDSKKIFFKVHVIEIQKNFQPPTICFCLLFQGLMDKKTLFSFCMQVAEFNKIPPPDMNKCMSSFFRFARELTSIRINISDPEQQVSFDLEVISYLPNLPILLKLIFNFNFRVLNGFPLYTQRYVSKPYCAK